MTAFASLQSWLARPRRVRLSSFTIGIFCVGLVVPWLLLAWLAATGRADALADAEHELATTAVAYGEHAATLRRLGSPVPSAAHELESFGRALNVPHVQLSIRPITEDGALQPPTRDDSIAAQAVRPAAGLVAVASMSKQAALQGWWSRTIAQAELLLLRSLILAVIGIFCVVQIRAKERLEKELVIAKDAAERASRSKSELLANTSHELRTPLNAIIGFSDIIRRGMFGPLSDRYSEYADHIHGSGKHLLGLINELLDLSKLEAGQLVLEEEPVDLTAAVRDCVTLVETQARRANVSLSALVPDDLPLIHADNRRIRQILINLLSNAVKFTPEGGRVQAAVSHGSDGFLLNVTDTGIGMLPEHIAKALEPFGQVDSAMNRKYDGTGLGLPIAKQLAALHGGSLSITSTWNAGTTVSVRLPAERAMTRQMLLEPARASA